MLRNVSVMIARKAAPGTGATGAAARRQLREENGERANNLERVVLLDGQIGLGYRQAGWVN